MSNVFLLTNPFCHYHEYMFMQINLFILVYNASNKLQLIIFLVLIVILLLSQ